MPHPVWPPVVGTAIRLLRRLAGVALALLVLVPFWKLLTAQGSHIALEAVRLTDRYAVLLARGAIGVLVVAAAAALIVTSDTIELPLSRIAARLESWSSTRYALALALVSGGLTAFLSVYVWETKPVLVDALAQFVHARYFAEGMLAGPPGFPYEFWVSANTFVTDHGWVSQYPPGHTAALAVGFLLGAVWLVCPLLMAVAAFFTSLTADRLFLEDRIVARIGALLFALSPFLASLAAAHMSHVTAVALLSVAAYCALRARDEHRVWAIGAGTAVGVAFATRSLTALVVGPVLLMGIWLFNYSQRERPVSFLRDRIALSFAGALPILVATAAYNARFFDSPFAFGYTAYLGPNHGLGYHFDPFGNVFGPTEGLAYISSDLVALGYFLFRTPISAVLVIGVYLATAARLTNGAKLAAAWALCLLVPYAAYWHHDLLLGPRMISDTAPAWCLLASVAAFGLVRMTPSDNAFFSGRFSPRAFVSSAVILSVLLGAVYFAPRDIRAYASTFAAAPAPPRANAPTLVFVHGPWDGRIVAKLLAAGMRADSVNVALTLNSTCSIQKFADALSGTATPGDSGYRLQLSFNPGVTDGSQPTRLPTGITIRLREGEQLSEACEAQAYADRGGPIPLMPLLWQGDLPGIRGAGAMYARDMGPTENARLIARYPQRRVGVLLRRPEDGRSTILPYDTAMNILWSNPAADSTAAETDAPLSP